MDRSAVRAYRTGHIERQFKMFVAEIRARYAGAYHLNAFTVSAIPSGL
jgi:hypothetical protein